MARRFDILINAKDNSSAVFKKAAGAIGAYFAADALRRGTTAVVNESAKFEHQMASVSTMLKTNVGPQTAIFTQQVRRLSTEFGQSKEVLSKGLFDILSAGVKTSKAMDVLTASTKAAIGGNTDTAVAVDGATTILNAFKLEAEESTRVFDLMFNTVREGKITFEELSENISKLAPLANAAGMELEDMFAAVATAVKVEKPDRAMTALSAALAVAAKEGKSLLQVVKELKGASLQEIFAAGFEKRSAQGIALLANNYEEFLNQVRLSREATGSAEKAFQQMAKTTQHSLNQMNQSWQDLKLTMGDLAVSTGFIENLKNLTKGLNQLNRDLSGEDKAAKKNAQMSTSFSLLDSAIQMSTMGFYKPDTEALFSKAGLYAPTPTGPSQAQLKQQQIDKLWAKRREDRQARADKRLQDAADKRNEFFDHMDAMQSGGLPKVLDKIDSFSTDLLAMSGEGVAQGILDKLPDPTVLKDKTTFDLKDILPTGPQQAFVTRGLSGLGTNMRPQEQTAKNTKTTNDKLDTTNDKLDALTAAVKSSSKSAVRLMASNLP